MPTPRRRLPSPDDSVLDSDSEIDEFSAGQADNVEDDEEQEQGGAGIWEPDEWDEAQDTSSEEEDAEDGIDDVGKLRKGLDQVPFSTILKAQRTVGRARSPDSDDSQSSKDGPGPSTAKARKIAEAKAKLAAIQQRKGKAINAHREAEDESDEENETEKADLKRGSKHAPTALSTKRQVSRFRQVVDPHKQERRDPRFSSVSAGDINPDLHSRSYTFMPGMMRDELAALKSAVATAVKAERNCPWSEKSARTAEREKLEKELARVRTRVERTEREARERQVLSKVKKEEREKQGQGKGAWFMKKAEKKDLLLKSKFQALEKQGGKTAVKRAIEKKRKKVAGKEKKTRPFARGSTEGGSGEPHAKRRRAG